MPIYPDEHILNLHAEFQQLKQYRDKVVFFDTHFGILEYSFPPFQPELDILFKPEGIDILIELFQKERRNSASLDRKYFINGNQYSFNITPLNTNPQILNDYILSKFISSDSAFNSELEEIEKLKAGEQFFLRLKQKLALSNIRAIDNKLVSGTERSFRSRFMNVFYNGYLDYINNEIKKFPYRKKYIELYLYAHGIHYGKYLEGLTDSLRFVNESHDEQNNHQAIMDWPSRILLFKELGILQLLKQKYSQFGRNMDDELARVICVILGQDLHLSERIKEYINDV
jgi:hypothetical protein